MATAGIARAAVRPKEFHFPLSVEWIGERRVAARVAGKSTIEIAPPPVFRGTDPATWSPEDFLVAAAASCLAVTYTGLAARAGLSYANLKVDADGAAGTRTDGRFGFTRLVLRLQVETHEAEEARRLAKEAEETCLVSASLDLPVETLIEVVAPPAHDRTNTRSEVERLNSRRRAVSGRRGPGFPAGLEGGSHAN
jgi:organic hydroperoxide reductase OsmC/OhrA